ncbi:hypothetical protein P3T27_008127 [Kitasatospora sp. MAA19]|uniref:hypothetical protein n=1 Tax=Kitasatospora sp. MAA19 TaxID=3035090 RepID=UPI00247473F6|nr:hypothetical protein [Kitasatospora sp. MAA19]MDH6711369.1 hypothetical protein [Kitasatospora sp. MAA19]
MSVTCLTSPDYTVVAENVAAQAVELTAVTACMDTDLHTVWLDEAAATIWHAYRDLDTDEWALDREPAAEAQHWIEEQLVHVLARLASPDTSIEYSRRPGLVEDDLEVLAELETVKITALRALVDGDAAAVDRMIRGQMDVLRTRIGLLARLRAVNLNQAYGGDRGAQAEASRALGVTRESARRAMDAADTYADRARAGAAKAHETDLWN